MSNLPKDIRETIAYCLADESKAEVYTRDPYYMQLLAKRAEKYPRHYQLIHRGSDSVTYKMSKSCLRFREPQYTDTLTAEQIAQRANHMRRIAEERKRKYERAKLQAEGDHEDSRP